MYKMASISEQGWISDPKVILTSLISNYLNTDAAQSLVFESNLISLSQTYYRYINDPDAMALQVRTDLINLISPYFTEVDIYSAAEPITGKHYAITVRVAAMDENGFRYDLARLMEIDTDSLRKIVELNNYGT